METKDLIFRVLEDSQLSEGELSVCAKYLKDLEDKNEYLVETLASCIKKNEALKNRVEYRTNLLFPKKETETLFYF